MNRSATSVNKKLTKQQNIVRQTVESVRRRQSTLVKSPVSGLMSQYVWKLRKADDLINLHYRISFGLRPIHLCIRFASTCRSPFYLINLFSHFIGRRSSPLRPTSETITKDARTETGKNMSSLPSNHFAEPVMIWQLTYEYFNLL